MDSIIVKYSQSPGVEPVPNQLLTGEPVMNTYDGRLFMKKSNVDGDFIVSFVNFYDLPTATVLSASFSSTASFVTPLRQNVIITGSLNISGSTVQVGDNTLLGNTLLSGSITISGSFPVGSYSASVNILGDTAMTGYLRFNAQSTNIDNTVSASYIYVSGSTNDLYFSQNGGGFGNTTRLRWLEGNLYTGLLNGGLISATPGSTTFNISSGSGIIVTINASINDNPYPTIKYVNWGNKIAQPLTYISSSIQTFVGINSDGNIIQQTNPWTDGQYNTSISIGTVLHQNKSTVNASITYPNVAYGYKQRTYDFIKAFGPLKLSGFTLIPSGSLGLGIGSGTAFAEGRNYQLDPNNPSYITDSGTSVSKIFRYYQSGSEFVQDTNNAIGYTEIDPGNYNLNGTLTPVPGTGANREWSIKRVFWYPNSATKGIVVYYGNATYPSSTDAIASLPYESFTETPNTQQNAIYVGAIAIRNNGSFADSGSYAILPGGVFRNVGGSGGGGTLPTVRLSDLSDVDLLSPTDHQPLAYDVDTLKWKNQSNISASISGNAETATTASYALTGSYADNFTVAGTLTAQRIVVQTISSSVTYSSGSNIFGNSLTNTQTFTGSVLVTGSLQVNGLPAIIGNLNNNYILKATNSNSVTSSLIYDNGTGIGIKTMSITNTFEISGSLGVSGTSNLNGAIITGTNPLYLNSYIRGATSGFSVNNNADTENNFQVADNGNARLFRGSLTLGSTTGVGVGTLYAGSITASSIIKSGGVSTEFLKADGSVDSSIYLTTSSASSSYQPLLSLTSGYIPKATGTSTLGNSLIYDDGVGVGINVVPNTSTATTLHVNGATGITTIKLTNTTTGTGISNGFDIYATGTLAVLNNRSNGSMYFNTNNTLTGMISNTGKWLLGASSNPGNKLFVVQDITYNDPATYALGIGSATSENKKLVLGYDHTIDAGFIEGFNSSVPTKIVIYDSKLLLGTTTDSGYKLDVNGTGRFSSLVSIIANSSAQNIAIQGRASDNYGAILFYSNNGLTRYGYLQSGSPYGGTVALVGDGGARIDLDNRGITGTGVATFNKNVTVGVGSDVENLLLVNGLTYSGLKLQRAGVDKWAIFNNNAGANFFDIYNYNTSSSALSISTTNAVTFSSSVTAASLVGGSTTTDGYLTLSRGANTTYEAATVYRTSGTGNWIVGMRANSTNNFVFYNGTTGTDSLVINASTGKVGIGTTSPNDILNLAGGASGAYGLIIDNSKVGGGVKAQFHYDADNSIAYLSGVTTNGLAFKTLTAGNITEKMRITDAGNVGIGTTAPQGNLEVVGLSYFTRSSQSVLLNPNYGGANTHTQIQVMGNMALAFATNGDNERVRITSGGNLLVGTTTDSGYKLDVNGTGRFTATADTYGSGSLVLRSSNSATNTYLTTVPNLFALSVGGSADHLLISSTGAATFSSSVTATNGVFSGTSSEPLRIERIIGGTVYGKYSLAISGSGVFSIYDAVASLDRFAISSVGNVGIGTTSPNYIIDAYSTSASAARINIGGTTNFVISQYTNSSGAMYIGIDDSAGANFTGTSYGRFIYSAGAYPLIFAVNATERMRITSGGSVLVGTTSTDVGGSVDGINLSQNKYIQVANSSTDNLSYIYYGDRRGTNNAGAIYMLALGGYFKASIGVLGTNSTPNDGGITFNTISGNTTSVEQMRITPSGVGIGTTSIDERLVVAGGTNTSIKINTATDNYAQLFFYENGSLKWNTYNDYVTDYYSVGNNSGRMFSITPTGVGTFASGLGINNAVHQTVLGAGLTIEGVSYSNLYFTNSNVLTGYMTSYSGGIIINTSVNHLTLNNGSGNVLVGTTTSSGYKFEVTGNAAFNNDLYVWGKYATTVRADSGVNVDDATGVYWYADVTSGGALAGIGQTSNGLRFYTGGSGSMTEKVRITSGGDVLNYVGRNSNAHVLGNMQEWVGEFTLNTGSSASLFAIASQYDILCGELNIFIDLSSYGGYTTRFLMGYSVGSSLSKSAEINNVSGFTVTAGGTLYNETMYLNNANGTNFAKVIVSLKVWGYGVRNNVSTGGQDLVTSSYLTRIK